MARHLSTPVKTFSIGFDEPSFDESPYAREVAACLGTDHHEEILAPSVMLGLVARLGEILDEPLADASILPTFLLSQYTRRHVTVALSGDGGDELFAGYPTYQAHQVARRLDWTPRPVLSGARALAARLPVSYARPQPGLQDPPVPLGARPAPAAAAHGVDGHVRGRRARLAAPAGRVARDRARTTSSRRCAPTRRAADDRGWLGTLLYLDAKLYLQDGVLVKVDRASMACSLEVRSPFLDTAVVEFASRLPAPAEAAGPDDEVFVEAEPAGRPAERILNRRKKGFGIPVGLWIRGPWRDLFHDMLAPDRLARQGLLNPDAVDAAALGASRGHARPPQEAVEPLRPAALAPRVPRGARGVTRLRAVAIYVVRAGSPPGAIESRDARNHSTNFATPASRSVDGA